MRKIIIFIILILISFDITSAYTPTQNENNLLLKLKQNTIEKTKTKGELWLKRQIIGLEKSYKKSNNDRIKYLLNVIIQNNNNILNDIQTERIQREQIEQRENLERLEKEKKEKIESENRYIGNASDFFNTHGKDITTSLEVNEKCTKYFDFVDNIARENNFPTELIIATWSIEFNCNLSNPNNGWGPFQITSHYYKPGEITLEQFSQSIQDFIDFSKGKWNYFNTNTYVDYKSRFGTENISISYDNYSLRDLRLHSILYNGIRSDTTLDKNTFTNTNLNSEVVGEFDGLVTRFLKILNWRIQKN
ncbi:MAG: hypothetical protein PHS49_07845 [Candidatus Gracilibacteria bacterium]|nr:hypothetical protein [Candidatus Gracilibacteria bacterium]